MTARQPPNLPRHGEWQPIATEIAINVIRIVWWSGGSGNWYMRMAAVNEGGVWLTIDGNRVIHPTHWMPLPEPPTVEPQR